ncbi:MAG TPA: immunoglobulin domain-containing protein [Steroidobacteraceae bacterium]|nr:immunoglobulin domain-containing protein [Steroidobacteraceae bacterium]
MTRLRSVRPLLATLLPFLAAATLDACGGGGGGGGSPAPAPVAPAITTQPIAATVADGGSVNFSVSASGDAPLTYQWSRNATALSDGAGITGSASNALTLTAPYAFNGSQIAVSVSNAAGKVVSNAAVLTVTAVSPSISQQPANVDVAAGMSATFAVKTTGGTSPVTYQWKLGGVPISGATTASFTVAAATLADNASIITVDVINPAGTITSSAATLSVTAQARNWGPAVLISSGDTLHTPGYPQTVMDSTGNAFTIWIEANTANARNAVWASRYRAGGTWTAAATIDNTMGNSSQPRIAITPSGIAVAAFSQSAANTGGIVNVMSTRYDSAWGNLQAVSSAVSTNAVDPQVAMGPDGSATLVFDQSDGTASRTQVAMSNTAGVWSGITTVGGLPVFTPQVAVAANGHAVMTWKEVTGPGGFTSAMWASRNVGAGWSVPVQISAISSNLGSIQIAADANGNAIAVWQDASSGRQAVFASRLDAASGVWSSPQALNDSTHNAFLPEIAVDGTGSMLVVWYEATDAAQAIGVVDIGVVADRFLSATTTWGGPKNVQPPGDPAGQVPNVAVDALGNAMVVWLQPMAGNGSHYELWSATFAVSGAAWGAPLKLMTDAAAYALIGSDQEPKIAMDANGDAVVVWYQQTDTPFALGIWTRVYR